MMKNHHLDLVRVTEAAAIAAAEWVGRGDKESADKASTNAMRDRLNQIDFIAEISIGEGKKDKSFGLFDGEIVGLNRERYIIDCIANYSIAVDPIEGTTPTSIGGYEAMSVIALANENCFFKTEEHYMYKIAVGPELKQMDLSNIPLHKLIDLLSLFLKKPKNRLTVCLLDRARNQDIIYDLRKTGCRIKLIQDCDVTACIATCFPDCGIDMYIGTGGSPEAVISAAAMKCLGGSLYAFLADKNGFKLNDKVMTIEDLAKGPVMFSATGITNGQLLEGVKFNIRGPVTNSITMRSDSGTIRRITTEHGN